MNIPCQKFIAKVLPIEGISLHTHKLVWQIWQLLESVEVSLACIPPVLFLQAKLYTIGKKTFKLSSYDLLNFFKSLLTLSINIDFHSIDVLESIYF
jgi:hypothetical protein